MITKFFKPESLPAPVDVALLAVRLVAGIAFIIYGYGKIQNPFGWMGPESTVPAVFMGLAALSEFGGGIAWALGLLTKLAALGIASTMIVAIYFHTVVYGDSFVSLTGGGSYLIPALFLVIAGLLFAAGPGRFSLDALLFKNKN